MTVLELRQILDQLPDDWRLKPSSAGNLTVGGVSVESIGHIDFAKRDLWLRPAFRKFIE